MSRISVQLSWQLLKSHGKSATNGIQSYLSIADTLYSGHLPIADRICWTRQNPYILLIKKPLYSGHGYSGHLVIADTFSRQFGQIWSNLPVYSGHLIFGKLFYPL